MSEKLIIGPIDKGLRTNRTAFNIDNDNFPFLLNAFQWRGRAKRKRGTDYLGRLQFILTGGSGTTLTLQTNGTYTLTITDLLASAPFTIRSTQPNAQIVPKSVLIQVNTVGILNDNAGTGVLDDGTGDTGTINYANGAITINFNPLPVAPPGPGLAVIVKFNYYPVLPVMGEEDFAFTDNSFPGTEAFDTRFSYDISTSYPYNIVNTNFYNNPVTGTYTNYVQKTTWTSFNWNGNDYQQFWTTNYQGALWATNGIDTPFLGANVGMQFKPITVVDNITAGPPAKARLHIATHGLVQGDFVYVNEVITTTGINWQTGYVTSTDPQDPNFVDVTFPNATITTNGTGGICQYLTSTPNPLVDCIRWYNGLPTNGSTTAPTFVNGKGWVNFMPPISENPFTIADEPEAVYYLVGARMIVPFKDRLLFIGPIIQSSASPPTPIYLQDTVIFSQNGTPYYTSSYTNVDPIVDNPTQSGIIFHPILVPKGQTATAPAYFDDSVGFGGYISAGLDQPIVTTAPNEDVLLMGFNPNYQARFVYTGNDILPFNFFIVNSELGSSSTFSAITMDQGVLSKGPRGYTIASQTDVARVDLDNPDEVFEINLAVKGNERLCSQRDFINEWVYFTYPSESISYVYPNTTFFYNYRDQSWAIFLECYTAYGTFRPATGDTWATLPADLTWNTWDTPWNSGSNNLLQPVVIGGNQQGFILIRTTETAEATSLFIQSMSGNTVTSPNHCLNEGDYILISGASGTVGSQVNGKVFSVFNMTTNTFMLSPSIGGSYTYFGNGLITRYYVPMIQTKQFPMSWGMGRKTRLGVQQYLLTKTNNAAITLFIYLSQDATNRWNDGNITPANQVENGGLVYSTTLYTCPESTNLGLTAPNTNLLQLTKITASGTSNAQAQIWHRVNTSLIGDTVQLGLTMSDAQMRDETLTNQVAEIELHAITIEVSPSSMLS